MSHFSLQLIDTSNEPIVTTVLKCIVDLLCVHGARVFEDDASESQRADESKAKSKRSTYHSIDAIEEDGEITHYICTKLTK